MWMKKALGFPWRVIRNVFWSWPGFAFSIAFISVLVLFGVGVDSLPLDLGEILTILGIWLMIGVLLGQNKSSIGNQSQGAARTVIKFGLCYLLFFVIVLVYMIKTDDPNQQLRLGDAWGLIMISLSGLFIGYFVGQDWDKKEED